MYVGSWRFVVIFLLSFYCVLPPSTFSYFPHSRFDSPCLRTCSPMFVHPSDILRSCLHLLQSSPSRLWGFPWLLPHLAIFPLPLFVCRLDPVYKACLVYRTIALVSPPSSHSIPSRFLRSPQSSSLSIAFYNQLSKVTVIDIFDWFFVQHYSKHLKPDFLCDLYSSVLKFLLWKFEQKKTMQKWVIAIWSLGQKQLWPAFSINSETSEQTTWLEISVSTSVYHREVFQIFSDFSLLQFSWEVWISTKWLIFGFKIDFSAYFIHNFSHGP